MYALLLDKNSDEMAVLSLVLQRAGLFATPTADLMQGLYQIEQPIELVVLAATDDDPQAQVQQVRAETAVPLIVVVNWADEELHYQLLENGADMVVVRPFSARLMIAQVRALLRRISAAPLRNVDTLNTSGLILDPTARTIQVNDQPAQRLTPLEFRLLYTLMLNRNQILPTQTIVEQVWGYNDRGDRQLVRGLIRRLRAKVEADPHHPIYILTIPGIGYSFAEHEKIITS